MGMGLATSDYDNDGDFDFFFTNAGPMALLQNLGDGTFADVAGPAGVDLGADGVGWGTVALDYDNDGFRDFYVALTDMLPDRAPTNPLFRNLGDGTFEDVTAQSGLGGEAGRTLGVAYADYDNDGWVDIVIGDYERGYTLFRNQAGMLSPNHRLAVRLVGGGPISRDAVGARVALTTTDGITQVQEVQCGSSLGAGNASTLYFGLGQAEVDSLTIRWPNGKVQQVGDLQPDYQYILKYLDAFGES
jgi:hypothetical protein